MQMKQFSLNRGIIIKDSIEYHKWTTFVRKDYLAILSRGND